MRTQHARPATLEEALLSLAAQSCDDFEVVLLPHDVAEAGLVELEALVEAFPPDFARRVRMIPVQGGGRSRPLNVGIKESRGRYVAILDDDDLAFAHWVSEFQKAEVHNTGQVLRALVAEQDVEPVSWLGSTSGYDVVSRPRCTWHRTFDVIEHFTVNHSPTGGWAVPRSFFADESVEFDESLPVLEDWDVLMQAVLRCGVSSIEEITALVRRWRTGDSSTSLHTEAEWHEARSVVLARLDAVPVVLPPGSATRLHIRGLQAREANARIDHLTSELSAVQAALQNAKSVQRRTEEELRAERRKISAIWSSPSWKVAKPLRGAERLVRRFRRARPT
jgi:hypothetical protein